MITYSQGSTSISFLFQETYKIQIRTRLELTFNCRFKVYVPNVHMIRDNKLL